MTFSDEDPRDQLHVRVDRSFKARVETFAEAHNMSQTELTRTALDEFLPEEETTSGPSDPKLREAYLWLRNNADDRDEIPAQLAMTTLAQELGMNKQLVRQNRLAPLERTGWIEPNFGTITVISPENYNNE